MEGLKPNTGYQFNITFKLATNVIAESFGIGESPSDSVYVKTGVLFVEPKLEKDATGVLRFSNVDIDRQSQSGEDALVVGNWPERMGNRATDSHGKLSAQRSTLSLMRTAVSTC